MVEVSSSADVPRRQARRWTRTRHDKGVVALLPTTLLFALNLLHFLSPARICIYRPACASVSSLRSFAVPSRRWFVSRQRQRSRHRQQKYAGAVAAGIRGGDDDDGTSSTTADGGTTGRDEDDNGDDDDERYSRQVYTLGARAHSLIRSSTAYLDGPARSGLLYEVAKNLALSGVRRIVIVVDDDTDSGPTTSSLVEARYHNAALDDLGNAYRRAAAAEIGVNENSASPDDDGYTLLQEYVQRLNPSIDVSATTRDNLRSERWPEHSGRRVLVAVDRPYATQVALNRIARDGGAAFVSVETAGVFGRLFCDFGPTFEVYDADGETPLVTPLDRVEIRRPEGESTDKNVIMDGARNMTVFCVEGEKHDVSKGDPIRFQWRDGSVSEETTCVVTEVQTPFRFRVQRMPGNNDDNDNHKLDEFVRRINEHAASFRRIKVPQKLSFEPLHTATDLAKDDSTLFTPCDLDKSFDNARRSASFSCFQALSEFVQQFERLPKKNDTDVFLKLVEGSWEFDTNLKEGYQQHGRNFLLGCTAKVSPLQCVFGAVGAQEAMKSISGLYYPTHQFLLYDIDELLPEIHPSQRDTLPPSESDCPNPLIAPGLRQVLGDKTVNRLQSQHLFVVGAGAIGCEILKNLASIGVGTGNEGKICLTDMDTIEKSNLSRQLLFRDSDVGKFKSAAAHEAALRFNSALKLESHSSKVGGGEAHNPFDDSFWSKNVNVVMNALDNVEARLYMDSQCVAHQKALIDAGTMGPKGNVQVVVPHQSESYASSADPPEPAIPVCTLKNFPYAISHTIQWGRDLFDGLFDRRPNQANDFISSLDSHSIDELAARLVREKGDDAALQAAEELGEDLCVQGEAAVDDLSCIRASSLAWAAKLASTLFYESVDELLSQHPLDSLDEDGEPFWSGTRRPPRALSFVDSSNDPKQQKVNENIIDFIRAASRLRFESYVGYQNEGESMRFSAEEVQAFLKSNAINSPEGKDGQRPDSSEQVVGIVRARLANVSFESKRLTAAEFEKDDESNDHVAFVNAASNLRAIAYGIPPVDAMETRRVAGNIVPAMITTTAFVSALSCIELIKLTQQAPLKLHRNAFINLALPFFAFTAPLPAEEFSGWKGKPYTLWDRLTVKEGRKAAMSGGISMQSLLRRIKKKVAGDGIEAIEVSSVSCGPYMLFANFLHDEDEKVLESSLWELVNEAITEDLGDSREGESVPEEIDCSNFVDLTVVVEDRETGDEIELPPVRVQRHVENKIK